MNPEISALVTRSADLLKEERLEQAEEAIERALSLDPSDVAARNVRGLIYLKSGRHEEARQVFVELERIYPSDPALRSNLGLSELRLGLFEDAARNLEQVVALEPENLHAQGFLGLALLRMGDLRRAKRALEKAGQHDLVKQIEDRMTRESDVLPPQMELRRAAAEGGRMLEVEQPFELAVEEIADSEIEGGWQLHSPGVGGRHNLAAVAAPTSPAPAQWIVTKGAEPLSIFAQAKMLHPGGIGVSFQLAEGGLLLVRVEGELPTRTWGAIASSGQLTFAPLERRVRGQLTDETFSTGVDGLFLAKGHGVVVVAPRGGKFTLLELQDEVLYLREPDVFSFETTLTWESGRIPGAGSQELPPEELERLRILQFRGSGRVVVKSSRNLYTLAISSDSTMFVENAALKGWFGGVVPRQIPGSNGEPTPYIECTGDGVILIEEPAA